MSRTLSCVNCGCVTEQEFQRSEQRKHTFYSVKEGKEKNADGLKDIWSCCVCGAERIYGAPEESTQDTKWTMRDEKAHIENIVKNFSKSRAVLFCATPHEWINGYIKGLDKRVTGFDGQPMKAIQKTDLKLFALTIQKKLQISQEKRETIKT